MKHITKTLIAAIAVASMFGGAFAASAQTATVSTTASTTLSVQAQGLIQQIQQLQQQIIQLQNQQKTAVTTLLTTLNVGSSGDAVKVLQALLAADPAIYPEAKITGFFGGLTKKAVMRFQAQNGLPTVGNVGPKTLEKLQREFDDHPVAFENSTSTASSTPNGGPCAIVPPGHLIAPGWLKHHDDERPIVPPCQTLPPGILGHGEGHDDHGDDGDHGDHGTSTPSHPTSTDVTAPVISNVTTTVASTSATVTWTTNEAATSQVIFGLGSSLGSSTVLDASLVTGHSQTLTGLTASSTYSFKVQSRDAFGNQSASDQFMFATGI